MYAIVQGRSYISMGMEAQGLNDTRMSLAVLTPKINHAALFIYFFQTLSCCFIFLEGGTNSMEEKYQA